MLVEKKRSKRRKMQLPPRSLSCKPQPGSAIQMAARKESPDSGVSAEESLILATRNPVLEGAPDVLHLQVAYLASH